MYTTLIILGFLLSLAALPFVFIIALVLIGTIGSIFGGFRGCKKQKKNQQ